MKQESTHGKVRSAIDEAQDLIGGLAGKVAAASVNEAGSFVNHAVISNMYEIQAAKIALSRSDAPEIQALAERMLKDHLESSEKLSKAVDTLGPTGEPSVPESLDRRRRKMVEHLEAAPSVRFDDLYLNQQLLAHEEAVTLMHSYREKGDKPVLRDFASDAARMVEGHRERVRALKKKASEHSLE